MYITLIAEEQFVNSISAYQEIFGVVCKIREIFLVKPA